MPEFDKPETFNHLTYEGLSKHQQEFVAFHLNAIRRDLRHWPIASGKTSTLHILIEKIKEEDLETNFVGPMATQYRRNPNI